MLANENLPSLVELANFLVWNMRQTFCCVTCSLILSINPLNDNNAIADGLPKEMPLNKVIIARERAALLSSKTRA
jgi:hypothetical protein